MPKFEIFARGACEIPCGRLDKAVMPLGRAPSDRIVTPLSGGGHFVCPLLCCFNEVCYEQRLGEIIQQVRSIPCFNWPKDLHEVIVLPLHITVLISFRIVVIVRMISISNTAWASTLEVFL